VAAIAELRPLVATKTMIGQQILYEAKLAKVGKGLSWAGPVVLAFWVIGGLVLCFRFDSFPSNLGALVIIGLGGALFARATGRGFRWRKNPGIYRISIDDDGLHVHSDDPAAVPSFTIVANDIYRLVRKTISWGDSGDEHEFYIETKSGARHRIEQLFADYDLDVMKMFEEITARFPWVQILEEVKQ